MQEHHYKASITWKGNQGQGTKRYDTYKRDYAIEVKGKSHTIFGSADPQFRGDNTKYNPEELLLSSIASCHMLWYLHLCADNGIVILNYCDECHGVMEILKNGSGSFKKVTLNPTVTITDEHKAEQAKSLHAEANKMCFIANSCNFSIQHRPSVIISN